MFYIQKEVYPGSIEWITLSGWPYWDQAEAALNRKIMYAKAVGLKERYRAITDRAMTIEHRPLCQRCHKEIGFVSTTLQAGAEIVLSVPVYPEDWADGVCPKCQAKENK